MEKRGQGREKKRELKAMVKKAQQATAMNMQEHELCKYSEDSLKGSKKYMMYVVDMHTHSL